MDPLWKQTNEADLAQGDLPDCLVPQFDPDYGAGDPEAVQEVPTGSADLIIVTQSCDLANDKVTLVALCPFTRSKPPQMPLRGTAHAGIIRGAGEQEERARGGLRANIQPSRQVISSCEHSSSVTAGAWRHLSWRISTRRLPATSCV